MEEGAGEPGVSESARTRDALAAAAAAAAAAALLGESGAMEAVGVFLEELRRLLLGWSQKGPSELSRWSAMAERNAAGRRSRVISRIQVVVVVVVVMVVEEGGRDGEK